jgi:hypothetical protein
MSWSQSIWTPSASHDEGERQRQVAPRRDPMQWHEHEASEPERSTSDEASLGARAFGKPLASS